MADYHQNCEASGTELVLSTAMPIDGKKIMMVHRITTAENHDEVRKLFISSTVMYESGLEVVTNDSSSTNLAFRRCLYKPHVCRGG